MLTFTDNDDSSAMSVFVPSFWCFFIKLGFAKSFCIAYFYLRIPRKHLPFSYISETLRSISHVSSWVHLTGAFEILALNGWAEVRGCCNIHGATVAICFFFGTLTRCERRCFGFLLVFPPEFCDFDVCKFCNNFRIFEKIPSPKRMLNILRTAIIARESNILPRKVSLMMKRSLSSFAENGSKPKTMKRRMAKMGYTPVN